MKYKAVVTAYWLLHIVVQCLDINGKESSLIPTLRSENLADVYASVFIRAKRHQHFTISKLESENSSFYAGAKTGKQPLQMFEHVQPKCQSLPRARMRSRGKAMPSCLCVCVCPPKNIEKCFKQGRKGVYRRHSQRKSISIIILGCFCTWYKSRWFFTPLFQLLLIIGFVAPPLSKSHTVSDATHTPMHTRKYGQNRSGNVWRGAQGKYPWIHSSFNSYCWNAQSTYYPPHYCMDQAVKIPTLFLQCSFKAGFYLYHWDPNDKGM